MKSIKLSLGKFTLSFFTLSIFLFINSCKKGDSASPYFIKCEINDTSAAFNYANWATSYTQSSTTYNCWILDTATSNGEFEFYGSTNDSSSWIKIGIDFFNQTNLSTGVYTDTDTNYSIYASYIRNPSLFNPGANPGLNYEASSNNYRFQPNNGPVLSSHLILNITSINSQSINGSFSGDFFLNTYVPNGGFPQVITIKNGNFFLKLKKQ